MQTLIDLPRHVHVERVMGTAVTFDVRGAEAHRGAVDRAVRWLHDVDATFSTYRPTSAIRRIDAGTLELDDAELGVQWMLERCEALRRDTAGAFDVRATGSLDPSALVKGWAVESAAGFLSADGATDFCITAGGDIACRGGRAPGQPWRIGIQHPLDRSAIAAVVALSGGAIATSGTYERGQHIIDPHTGRPPEGVLSATVTGPDLAIADAYSTAVFAMGTRGPVWTAYLQDGYEAMTILADESVLTTAGFPLAPAAA